jgi:REP element-mobilizing transposase RayT/DNA-binding response OmpR family regulator
MGTPLLVVTPQTAFGALIRKGLKDNHYDVHVTADFSEAIMYVRNKDCPVVLLDAEMEDVDISILDIGYALSQVKHDIQFIVITRAGLNVDTRKIHPTSILTKPVSMTDLQKALAQVSLTSATRQAPARPLSAPPPEPEPVKQLAETQSLLWLKDVSRAAQHLTRLTLESSAQAALIANQNELWAYAGQLSRDAAQELGRSIQKYWENESQSDLLRFVRLEATGVQHMLYATRLSTSMVLALVFDAETPFSTIRSQAGKLAKSLAETKPEELDKIVVEPEPDLQPGLPDSDLPPLSELLGEVPPPNPVKGEPHAVTPLPWESASALPGRGKPEASPAYTDYSQMAVTRATPVQANPSRESSPSIQLPGAKRLSPTSVDETVASKFTRLATDVEEASPDTQSEIQLTRKQHVDAGPVRSSDPQSLVETRPGSAAAESLTEVAHRIVLEPVSPALYNLNYACLLLPRFDHHHLVGDLAENISAWIPQVCIAFGWRLEHFSIRPDYVQWVVNVPPNTAPGYLMRICRQQTSDRIFSEFPRFKKENPSGDFWAPGYLIMGGSQPHPPDMVRNFIKQTRDRQGITKPIK